MKSPEWMKKYRGVLPHLVIVSLLISLSVVAFVTLNSTPKDAIAIEGESFSFDKNWVILEDVNLSSNKAIISHAQGSRAVSSFNISSAGNYIFWIRYFGNYGNSDLEIWKRAYTNTFGYFDLFSSKEPLSIAFQVDDLPLSAIKEEGSHKYKWIRINALNLTPGPHTIKVFKPDNAPGGITLDKILISGDPDYRPDKYQISLRDFSNIFGPALIIGFPILLWLYFRKERKETGSLAIFFVYSVPISLLLSILWIDTDGGFWIWLSQSRDFTLPDIYSSGHGEALHHRYVYPPPIAVLLIGVRYIFNIFGAMDGITPLSLILSKTIILPFFIGAGALLYRLEGNKGLLLWVFNSIVIFTIAANSMYFGLAFILLLVLYFVKKERFYSGALAFGFGFAYMSATALLLPPFVLLLRGFKISKILLMTFLAFFPGFLILMPHRLYDPAGVNLRVMGAGISTWMGMHLGMRLGDIGITTLLYGALLAYLWVKKPKLDYETLSAVFASTALIYLNIGAPHFLAWTVAFQPFIIIWAKKLRQEMFYSLYITALMVWGSFYLNTGGANDRAGETGFFPYYVFYSWPFDVYGVLRSFYGKIDYFSQPELEALSHSLSAGLSLVLFLLIASRFVFTNKAVMHE